MLSSTRNANAPSSELDGAIGSFIPESRMENQRS
jgi:hypothetical protein